MYNVHNAASVSPPLHRLSVPLSSSMLTVRYPLNLRYALHRSAVPTVL